MKVLKLTVLVLVLAHAVQAQVSVNVNIGTPPPWGPAGYTEVRYYYLPDVEAYYDVQSSMFIYLGNGVWVRNAYLPGRYRNYNLYDGYKVVITDYRGNEPYMYFKNHKMKYARGYRGGPQKTIGQKPGNGNFEKGRNSDNQPKRQESHGNNQPNRQVNQGNNQHEGHGNGNGESHGGGGGGKGRKK